MKGKCLTETLMLMTFFMYLHKKLVLQLDVITFINLVSIRLWRIHYWVFIVGNSFVIVPDYLSSIRLFKGKVKGNENIQDVVVVQNC